MRKRNKEAEKKKEREGDRQKDRQTERERDRDGERDRKKDKGDLRLSLPIISNKQKRSIALIHTI